MSDTAPHPAPSQPSEGCRLPSHRANSSGTGNSLLPGALAIVGLALIAYWPAFGGQFVWDDFLLLKKNPLLTGALGLRSVWFQTDFPLSTVVFWLEWLAFGKDPAGYHVVNVALHVLSAMLIWRLLAWLRIRGAWLAAALFAVHPVCAGSVAWISELKNTLSLPFFLLSFWCYAAGEQLRWGRQSPGLVQGKGAPAADAGPAAKLPSAPEEPDATAARGRHFGSRVSPTGWYCLSLACFLLALLSKTSTVVLPPVLLLWAWWQRGGGEAERGPQSHDAPARERQRGTGAMAHETGEQAVPPLPSPREEDRKQPNARLASAPRELPGSTGTGEAGVIGGSKVCASGSWREDWLRTSPFFALALGFGLLTMWFQSHQAFTTATVQTEGFAGRLAGAGWAVWFYLGKALAPLRLSAIYPRWQIQPASALAWVPALLLAAAFLVCWRFRRGWGRHALFGLGCFAVALFPALGFFDMYYLVISRVADHFQYLPLIAIMALVAATATSLGALSPMANRQSPIENGPLEMGLKMGNWPSLLLAAVLLAPLTLLSFNRCRVFATNEALWRDTLASNPAAWTAHNNLGCILAEKTLYDQAYQEFEASVRINPQNADAHANLGQVLSLLGRMSDAEAHFHTALTLKPDSADAHRYYAGALARQGRIREALPLYREALRLEPDFQTRVDYGALLYQSGNVREAVSQLRQAVALKPDQPQALNNLAWLLATASDGSVRDGAEAVRLAERACRLTDNKQAGMLGTLAAAYAEAGRFPEATTTAELASKTATEAGETPLAGMIKQLLSLYRAGRAYHEPRPK